MFRPRNYFRWHRVRKANPATLEYETPRAEDVAKRVERRKLIEEIVMELVVVPVVGIGLFLLWMWWKSR